MPQDQNPQPSAPNPHAGRPRRAAEDLRRGGDWPRAAFWSVAAALGAILALVFIPLTQDSMPWNALRYSIPNFMNLLGEPWQLPRQSLKALAVGGCEIAGLFGLGYGMLWLVRPWRRMLPLAAERAALALPVAAVPASLAVLGLGLAGGASRGVYGGLLGAVMVLGLGGWVLLLRDLSRIKKGIKKSAIRNPQSATQFSALRTPRSALHLFRIPHSAFRIFLALMLALAAVYALAPATESDELRYHLAAPAAWLRDGRIHYLPYQAFSNFPMLGEMLFMPALALGGDGAAKLIHLAFLPVCMMLTVLLARRLRGDRRRAGGILPAGAGFAFIPLVPVLAAWGWIDMFVTAYFLAFVYLAGRALARPRRASGTLTGLVAGGGIGVKYTMLALLGALGLVWSALRALTARGRAGLIRLVAGIALVTLLCGGAWYAKNWAWTHNPFYPLAYSIFGGGEWSQANADFYLAKAGSKGMHFAWAASPAGKAAEFLLSPVCATFFPGRFEDNPIGPLPLMALALCLGALLVRHRRADDAFNPQSAIRNPQSDNPQSKMPAGRRRYDNPQSAIRNPQFIWVLAAALISWMAWFTSYQSNRFLLPTLALLLALGAWAWGRWTAAIPAWARRVLGGLFVLGAVFSFLFFIAQMLAPWSVPGNTRADAVAVALGFEDREFYLARRLNYWSAAHWLAQRARPGEKALLVGEQRTLYFTLPVVASDWFDTPQPIGWIKRTANNDEMLALLRREGVRYIFYNHAELAIGRQFELFFKPRLVNAGPGVWERFQALWTNPKLKQIYPRSGQENVEIFEII